MKTLIPSLAICNPLVQAACVTANSEYGYGVFTWNQSMEDAKHNADITNGLAVPIDWINGEVIIPEAAKKAISTFMNH